jgi:GPH family glycoside/pentoside/hexuronide:cation symporter
LVCACIMIVAVFLIFGLLIGVSSSTHMYIMTIIVNFPIAAFWTLYVSMTYDLSELDEWINNKRREGILLSVVLFVQKVGAAIVIQLAGILLGMVGYQNGMMQAPETIDGIVKISFVCPAILIAVAALLFIKYPLTREKFAALQTALVARRDGKECSDEGFKNLL